MIFLHLYQFASKSSIYGITSVQIEPKHVLMYFLWGSAWLGPFANWVPRIWTTGPLWLGTTSVLMYDWAPGHLKTNWAPAVVFMIDVLDIHWFLPRLKWLVCHIIYQIEEHKEENITVAFISWNMYTWSSKMQEMFVVLLPVNAFPVST